MYHLSKSGFKAGFRESWQKLHLLSPASATVHNTTKKWVELSVTETADPNKKDTNLIIDVAISPNNVDDAKILNDKLDEIIELVPEINELLFDGG